MRILSLDPSLDDFKYYDDAIHRSLVFLNNEEVKIEDLYMTYTITDNGKVVELIPNG